MCVTFTEDDREKRVENANGELIGTITEVEGESATVEPRNGVLDSIRATIGWNDTPPDAISVGASTVDEITADTVRLEGEPTAETDGASYGAAPSDDDREYTGDEPARDSTDESAVPVQPDANGEPDDAVEQDPGTGTGESSDESLEELDGPAPTNAAGGDDETADRDARPETVVDDVDTTGEEADDTDGPVEEIDGAEEDGIVATEEASMDDESESVETEEMDLAAELNPGIDDDSLEEVGGREDETGFEDREPAAEIDRGPDVESAIEAETAHLEASDSSEDESRHVGDELETGVDIDSAAESEEDGPREIEIETEGVDEPAAEIDPGVDVVSTARESREQTAESETEPGEVAETPEDATDRHIRPETVVSTVDVAEPERDREDRSPATPVTAAVATQRAMLESTMAVQQGGLEIARAAGRSYLNAVASVADDAARSGEPTAPTERGALADEFADHAAELRDLQESVGDDSRDERVAELLERQVELLEQCQRQLERETE